MGCNRLLLHKAQLHTSNETTYWKERLSRKVLGLILGSLVQLIGSTALFVKKHGDLEVYIRWSKTGMMRLPSELLKNLILGGLQ